MNFYLICQSSNLKFEGFSSFNNVKPFFLETLVNFLKQHVQYLKKKATQSVCKIVYNIFQPDTNF